jgi:hypothetical protein
MDKILAKLSPKSHSIANQNSVAKDILSKLSGPHMLFEKPQAFRSTSSSSLNIQGNNLSSELPTLISGTGLRAYSASTDKAEKDDVKMAEMLRLKQELMAANSRIAQQEQELAQTRVIKHTLDQALGPPSEVDFGGREVSEQTISHLQDAFNASARIANQRQDTWHQDDAQSDVSDALSAGAYNRARNFWAPPQQMSCAQGMERGYQDATVFARSTSLQDPVPAWSPTVVNPVGNPGARSQGVLQPHRVFSGPSSAVPALDGRYTSEQNSFMNGLNMGPRRSITQMNRGPSCLPSPQSTWGPFYGAVPSSVNTKNPVNHSFNAYQQIGMYPMGQYQPRPIGTPLSPTAAEFTSTGANSPSWPANPVSHTFLLQRHPPKS